jgi:hypothetical protein
MTILDILNSEGAITLVGGILGAVWTAFRSQEWYQRASRRRFAKALQALEAGVEQVYRTYVRAIKVAREDGALTDDEAERARRLAKRRAIEFGRTTGVDVVRELGEEYLDLWISKLVRRAQN